MTRKTWTVMWTAALVGTFITTAAGGLFSKDDPAKVTERFWKAVMSGGAKAARPYMTKASQTALDQGTLTLTAGEGSDIIIGETKIQGNKATVIVEFPEKPGEQLTTFLVKEGGNWKIDLTQTVMGMLSPEDRKRMEKLQGKTFDELAADPEIAKQLEEVKGKVFEKMSEAMAAMGHELSPEMARAMGVTTAESDEAMFLLRDMGWGDPFIDPRDRRKETITPDDIIPDLGDEKKKVWEDALAAMTVEVIIGFKDDLAAVVSGVRVRPGDTIRGDKLRFKVERITTDAVHLRCISEEEDHKKFLGITVKRNIPL